MKPGQPLKYDTEYKRNGTANIFIAFEPLTGQRYTKVTAQRTKVDWAHFIQELVDQHYPHVEKICLVMDNLNTHTKASLYEAFDPTEAKRIADKLDIHYTPKHGSWLNMAEIELSHRSRQCLGVGCLNRFLSVDRFLDSRCHSRLSSTWRPRIFKEVKFTRRPQWRPMTFFITV